MLVIKIQVSLLLVSMWSIVFSCPPKENIYPCTCDSSGWVYQIFCPRIQNEQNLMDVLYSLKGLKKFYSFTITEGNFRYIPHDAFKDVKFQELQIISSSFMSLTDGDVAFEGLEKDLVSLIIRNCSFLNAWDWSVFRGLSTLVKLELDVDMEVISEDIALINPLYLNIIDLSHNKITYISDEAFAGCSQLLTLALGDNLITEVKRSMLPRHANLLWKIDLSFNKIEKLPPDLFENMPSLEVLSLNDNKILTLNEKTFEYVWGRLRYLYVHNNDLMCDCRLSWILGKKFPGETEAHCEQPRRLRGKSITSLTSGDLRCFYGQRVKVW